MANQYTDLLKLRMPALGDVGWDDEVNDNTMIHEFLLGAILKSNVVIDGLVPSDGGGLDVDVTAGNVVVGGAQYAVGSGSKTCSSGQKNWLYVDSSGVLQVATTQPTGDYVALALIDAGTSTIDRIADARNIAEGALTIGVTHTPENYEADTSKTGAINQHLAGVDTQIGLMSGFRNLLINGNMQISERAVSFTGLSNNDTGYTLDRWQFAENGTPTGVVDIKQTADHPLHGGYCLEVDVTTAYASPAAGDAMRLQQKIEAQYLQHLRFGTPSAQSLTLSFWVKSYQTGPFPIGLYADDGSASITASYTVNASNTWEYKTVTFPGYTTTAIVNDNGTGLRVWFPFVFGTDYLATAENAWEAGMKQYYGSVNNLLSSTSNNLRIADVQLEVGEVATPFEQRDIGGFELALCRRYYWKWGLPASIARYYSNSGNYRKAGQITLPVEMAGQPTFTILTAPSYGNCSNLGLIGNSKICLMRVTVSSTGDFYIYGGTYEAVAEL
jgi:hypothetical protein